MVAETEVRGAQLLIAGQYVDAASGEVFSALNPAKDQAIARVAKAGIEDVDRAIAAARKAFDSGPWPKMSPYERGRYARSVDYGAPPPALLGQENVAWVAERIHAVSQPRHGRNR